MADISFGPHAGKLVAIVDVIDQNRVRVGRSILQSLYNVAVRLTATWVVPRVARVVLGWSSLDYSFTFEETLATEFEAW